MNPELTITPLRKEDDSLKKRESFKKYFKPIVIFDLFSETLKEN